MVDHEKHRTGWVKFSDKKKGGKGLWVVPHENIKVDADDRKQGYERSPMITVVADLCSDPQGEGCWAMSMVRVVLLLETASDSYIKALSEAIVDMPWDDIAVNVDP